MRRRILGWALLLLPLLAIPAAFVMALGWAGALAATGLSLAIVGSLFLGTRLIEEP